MQDFYRKIKLVDSFNINLNAQKDEFVHSLNHIVENGDTSYLFSVFEAFSSSKYHYKGHVNHEGFKLRKRMKIFEMNLPAIAIGKFHQKENGLDISINTSGINSYMKFFFVAITLFYIAFISIFLSTTLNSSGAISLVVFPFIVFHGAIMMGLPYLMIRRGVKQLRYDLEREFHFISK